MECAVNGCNFLLKAVRHEAFSYQDGQAHFNSDSRTHLSYDSGGILYYIQLELRTEYFTMCTLTFKSERVVRK